MSIVIGYDDRELTESQIKCGYTCDSCKEKEEVVGNLSTGRFKSGWDYQVCEECKESNEFKELMIRENKEG